MALFMPFGFASFFLGKLVSEMLIFSDNISQIDNGRKLCKFKSINKHYVGECQVLCQGSCGKAEKNFDKLQCIFYLFFMHSISWHV